MKNSKRGTKLAHAFDLVVKLDTIIGELRTNDGPVCTEECAGLISTLNAFRYSLNDARVAEQKSISEANEARTAKRQARLDARLARKEARVVRNEARTASKEARIIKLQAKLAALTASLPVIAPTEPTAILGLNLPTKKATKKAAKKATK